LGGKKSNSKPTTKKIIPQISNGIVKGFSKRSISGV